MAKSIIAITFFLTLQLTAQASLCNYIFGKKYIENKLESLLAYDDKEFVLKIYNSSIEGFDKLKTKNLTRSQKVVHGDIPYMVTGVKKFGFSGNLTKQKRVWKADRLPTSNASENLLNILKADYSPRVSLNNKRYPDVIYWIKRKNEAEPVGAIRITTFEPSQVIMPDLPEESKRALAMYGQTTYSDIVIALEAFSINSSGKLNLVKEDYKPLKQMFFF